MIAALICRCGGAEPKARKFFQSHGVDDWLAVPVYTGKIACQEFIKQLVDREAGPDPVGSLQSFLSNAGSFVVIIGYDDEHFMWSNINRGGLKELADAELILEQFA